MALLMDLLDQMTTFVRVVEGGSLAAAARSLNRSVPALSRQLSALEHELGVPLIVRSTRRHQVTDAGQVWYQRSKTILEEVEAARRSVRPGSVQGRLTVSAPITIGLHCVVPALGKLMSQYPKLKVEVSLDDSLVDLVASGVDVVVRAGAPLGESTSRAGPARRSRCGPSFASSCAPPSGCARSPRPCARLSTLSSRPRRLARRRDRAQGRPANACLPGVCGSSCSTPNHLYCSPETPRPRTFKTVQ